MSGLRVLVAHCRYRERGGEDAVATAEAALLERHGHPLVRLERDNRELAAEAPVQIARETLWSTTVVQDATRTILRFRPDIIHAHNTFPQLSPSLYWAAARAQVPVVQTLHNFRLLCPQAMLLRRGAICEDCVGHTPWRGIVRRCYHGSMTQSSVLAGMLTLHRLLGTYREKVTRYIALNEFCRRKFIAGGLPAERIVVKPNFVDMPPLERHPARHGGLFVGRIAAEKGIDVLLAALDRCPAGPLDVVGSGPLAARLATHDRVRMLGWQAPDQVLARMRSAAYLVMPSIWYENFPRTLVEAYACGLPVIASRLGALAELVADGRTGILVEPSSAIALGRALEWAERHPERMREMGIEARREYELRYTAEQNYRALLEIYEDAIESQDRRAA